VTAGTLGQERLKNPCELVNLPADPVVYQLSANERPSSFDKISVSGKRSRGHDGTHSRELLE
jgi:hypothetical protein